MSIGNHHGGHRRNSRPHSLADVLERLLISASFRHEIIDPRNQLFLEEHGVVVRTGTAGEVALTYLRNLEKDNALDPSGKDKREKRAEMFRNWERNWEKRSKEG